MILSSIFIHFPILVFPIALVYGATRHEDPKEIIIEALKWLYRLVMFLGTIGVIVAGMSWII